MDESTTDIPMVVTPPLEAPFTLSPSTNPAANDYELECELKLWREAAAATLWRIDDLLDDAGS